MIIDLLCAIVLGVVEGITEWLPISSTAHLILVLNSFEGFLSSNTIFNEEFKLVFDVVVQLGAIIAVVIIYFNRLNPFKESNTYSKKEKIDVWIKVFVACIPIVIVGFFTDSFVTTYFYNLLMIGIVLIVYGLVFIIVESYCKEEEVLDIKDLGMKKSFMIGCVQVLALIPGTSRSGVTIIFGRMFKLGRVVVTEYSFFLSIPIMFGASIYKMGKYLISYGINLNELIILLIGMLVAVMVSLFVIKKLLDFVKKYSFKVFGFYRILLGIIILIVYFS